MPGPLPVRSKTTGFSVEGDPGIGYTETHQVIVRVGYGKGPEMADRLEKNNIICNYQASPDDEGFTAASCLRMGVQEMTRFGMKEDDFAQLAELDEPGDPAQSAGRRRGLSIPEAV